MTKSREINEYLAIETSQRLKGEKKAEDLFSLSTTRDVL